MAISKQGWKDFWTLHVPLILVLALCTYATVVEVGRAAEGVTRGICVFDPMAVNWDFRYFRVEPLSQAWKPDKILHALLARANRQDHSRGGETRGSDCAAARHFT